MRLVGFAALVWVIVGFGVGCRHTAREEACFKAALLQAEVSRGRLASAQGEALCAARVACDASARCE